MKTQLMFAYGMNTSTKSMASRCSAAVPYGAAVLYDYEFRFVNHADVVPVAGAKTVGVLWEITDECLASLDRLEGYGFYYDRKTVRVLYRNEWCDALVYFMLPGNDHGYPSSYYVDMLEEGYTEHSVSKRQIYQALDRLDLINLSGVNYANVI